MMSEIIQIKKKICLLGSFGVGKTSLIRRYVYDQFDDSYLSTIGVKITQKDMPARLNDQQKLQQYTFMLWDIEGYEQLGDIKFSYYRGAEGAILVTDMTRPETIQGAPQILTEFCDINPAAKIVLAANKADLLEDGQKITPLFKQIPALAGHSTYLTSAKSGRNVQACFQKLAELL